MVDIRTRFAPSPTGYLHIGGLRAALFEYAYAKSVGGKFILRIEDTDRKRFVLGATEKLVEILKLFGIIWDEGPEIGGSYAPYIQSERLKSGLYKKYAEELVKKGQAYYCFCEVKSGEEIKKEHLQKKVELRDPCRNLNREDIKKKIESKTKPAIRLRISDAGNIGFHDFILDKDVSWDLKDVDEAMLLKSNGFPTYHLGVVVDDIEMKISHILRGFEWLPSTPIHLLLFKYLGCKIPEIGHFSLILDPKGGKLSKRKGNVACEQFLQMGYLPEAILNFVMLLGWAPKDNREIFNLNEFVENFRKGNLQVANSVFNIKKLDWFSGYYIRRLSDSKLTDKLFDFYHGKYAKEILAKTVPLIKNRIVKLSDYETLAGFFFEVDKQSLALRAKKLLGENFKSHLEDTLKVLEDISDWSKDEIDGKLQKVVGERGYKTGDFFMDLRIAVTGSRITPPINDSIVILRKEETLKRIKKLLK